MCKELLNHTDMVVITDRDDVTIRYVNPATLKLLGYEAGDLFGTPVNTIFFDPKDRDTRILPELRRRGSFANYQIVLRTKSGDRVYALASTKRMPGGGTIGIGKDISREVNADRERLEMMYRSLEMKSRYLRGHSERTYEYASLIAQQLNVPSDEMQELERGVPLHDIGKMRVDSSVLNSRKRFKAHQDPQLRLHPENGDSLLQRFAFYTPRMRDIVLYHHERMDGYGYPKGLTGGEVPQLARVVKVADVFDALTTKRPYRTAHSIEWAMGYIKKNRGTEFDYLVANNFLKIPSSKLREIRSKQF